MFVHRSPDRALKSFVDRIWYFDAFEEEHRGRAPREIALPTGSMDLVLRLSADPIRVFDGPDDALGRCHGTAAISGVRSTYYVRDTSMPTRSIGVHFRPGGAAAFLRVPAYELAGRHTPLEDLWGREASAVREQLLAADSMAACMDRLEAILLARRPERSGLHPAVALVLARISAGAGDVGAMCRETGYSHRRLNELFRRSVGLTPKPYARIRRFQRVLERAARGRPTTWASLAQECGYFDQSHLVREFRAFAGSPPGAYEPFSRERPNHVPLRGSIPSKPAAPARG